MVQSFQYPTSDLIVNNWVGSPINTVGNLYQNTDEGVASPNDTDYIRNSTSLDLTHTSYSVSGLFGFGNCTVVPSSNMILDLRIASSSLVAGLTGSIYVSKAIFKNSNSDIRW
jgi:hypothetical protein